jgi:hypothetical protein
MVKDETRVAFEHHLILDVVISTLIVHQRMYAQNVNGGHTLIEDFTTASSIYPQLISDERMQDIDHQSHLLSVGIVNFGVISGVADFLKNGRFACVSSPYDQNSKAPNSFSEVLCIDGCHREILMCVLK